MHFLSTLIGFNVDLNSTALSVLLGPMKVKISNLEQAIQAPGGGEGCRGMAQRKINCIIWNNLSVKISVIEFILRIKEQETHLTLQEHHDDDGDEINICFAVKYFRFKYF